MCVIFPSLIYYDPAEFHISSSRECGYLLHLLS
jgi:hypothetical protein